jgi:AraC family transcriptional regulator
MTVSANLQLSPDVIDRLKQFVRLKKGGLARSQGLRVVAHIELHLSSRLSNDELSQLAGLSIFHFGRAFRNTFGESPHSYVIRRRIELAQRLMVNSNLSLSQIAADCGMADQAHFCKLFRRFVGVTPNAWRRDQWERVSECEAVSGTVLAG